MEPKNPTPAPIVYEQFKQVRDSGKVNMLNLNGVMQEANKANFYDLVSHLADISLIGSQTERSAKYMEFLEGFQG